jgi:hypothetical protein
VQAGPTGIRIGDLIIGVRTNDEEMSAVLAGALRPYVVADVEPPPNLSLKFGQSDGPVRGLHFLYRGGRSVVRTDSRGRLLRASIRHLEGFAPVPAGLMCVNAKLLLCGDDAILVDDRFGGIVDVIERRLHRSGYRVVDVHPPAVDRETLEVRLNDPRLDIDRDGRAEIDRRYPPTPHEVELHDGSYRLRGLVVWGDPEPDGQSPAQQYAELTPLVTDRGGSIAAGDLEVLLRLRRSCETVRIAYPDARQLFTTLRDFQHRAV